MRQFFSTRFIPVIVYLVLLSGVGVTENVAYSQPWFEFVDVGLVGITYVADRTQIIDIETEEIKWEAPPGTEIINMKEKFGSIGLLLVLVYNHNTNSTELYKFQASKTAFQEFSPQALPSSEDFHQIVGDALYAVAYSGRVYVTRNDGLTWQIDTSGLNGSYVNKIDLDTSQYVYAATNKGLYKQHPDSNIWRRVDSLYAMQFNQMAYPNFFSVFVDRRNFIFVNDATFGTFVSRNNGASWSFDTVGIRNRSVKEFGDDRFGNVYAITTGSDNRLYRSSDSGHSWIRIDQNISGVKLDPNNIYPFADIEGDSMVFLATIYGTLVTADQGATWTMVDSSYPGSSYYSYSKFADRELVSTEKGLYHKKFSDNEWTKSFPSHGYLGGLKPHRDGGGNIYTTGEASNLVTAPKFYTSTDNGTTWSLDTAGYSLLKRPGFYYVDETGTQHFVAPIPSVGGVKIYAKTFGGSWGLDTAGFKSTSFQDKAYAMVSDRVGTLYLAGKFSGGGMWKRPVTGGTWTLDTAGLGIKTSEFLTVDRNGNPYTIAAVEYPKHAIYKKAGGAWTRLPHPAAGPSASRLSVDSTNALWGSFYDDPYDTGGSFEVDTRGIYVSTNSGTTWTKVGVDTTVILGLSSYGDTTYALTRGRGVFAMKSSGVLVPVKKNQPASVHIYELHQNFPNPFNPATSIRFAIPTSGFVSLKVYDLLGREAATLVNEERSAGNYEVQWDARYFSSGIYFYTLESGPFSQTKKLLLMK